MDDETYVEQLLDRGLSEQEIADLVAQRVVQSRRAQTESAAAKSSAVARRAPEEPEPMPSSERPPEAAATHMATSVYTCRTTSFVGPLPSPEVARAYEDILPGATERLLAIYEQDSAATRRLLADDSLRMHRGQTFAFMFALASLGASVAIAAFGYPIAGTTFGGVTLVAIVTAFLSSRAKQVAVAQLGEPDAGQEQEQDPQQEPGVGSGAIPPRTES